MNSFLKAAQYDPKSPNEQVEGLSVILPLGERNGYVFVLAYLNKKSPDNEFLLELLYDHVHRLANAFGKDANAQHRFEQFLGALNETILQCVKEGRFSIPIQQFHAIVGIVSDENMFLSGRGDLTALFLHRKPTQRYQVFNLFRGIQTEQSLPTWEKTFAIVLDGDLQNGDVFCVSHKDIQHQIPQDELNSIVTSLPPKSAVEKIRQYFPANDGLLLIILKAESAQSSVPESYAKPLSDVSIDSFIQAQDETKAILADQKPDLFGFIKKMIESIKKKYTDKSRVLTDLRKKDSHVKTLMRVLTSTSRHLIKYFSRTIRKSSQCFQDLKNTPSFKTLLKKFTSHIFNTIRSMPKRKKLYLLLFFFSLILFTFGIISLSTYKKESEAKKLFSQNISVIQELVERAGGAIIYQDEAQARILYAQASEHMERLVTQTESEQKTVRELKAEIETGTNTLRHIVSVSDPTIVIELPQTETNAQIAQKMIRVGSTLYLSDDKQTILQLDVSKKELKALTLNPVAETSIVDLSLEDDDLFALTSGNQVLRINKKTGESSVVPFTNPLSEMNRSLSAYAHRLYILHSTNDEDANILKFQRAGTGYGVASSWISSKTQALNQAKSFVIDGSLYVLFGGGNVSQFQSGAQTSWQLASIEPTLSDPTKIWTDADSAFFYVLDPTNHRVAVFKKETGAFVVQYVSASFSSVLDFSIDEKTQTIYLLTERIIYSISANHLKK